MSNTCSHDLKALAARLLQDIGDDTPECITPLSGGRNNNVHLITTPSRKLVLKQLFHSPVDPRDRFQAENLFYNHCARTGVKNVPSLLASSESDRILLLEYIDGRKPSAQDIGRALISDAIEFIVVLNKSDIPKTDLSPASESCFSIKGHLELIETRIAKLENHMTNRTVLDLVRTKFRPLWENILTRVERYDQKLLSTEVKPCVSPSDFGFHNCLVHPDRGTVFFDFEYAGWDDPAKLICDFFCQVEIPVPNSCFHELVDRLSFLSSHGADLSTRVGILLPAYKLKWCCILLNEFLPADRERREFAGARNTDEKLIKQLSMSKSVFDDADRLMEAIQCTGQ